MTVHGHTRHDRSMNNVTIAFFRQARPGQFLVRSVQRTRPASARSTDKVTVRRGGSRNDRDRGSSSRSKKETEVD